MNPNQEEKKPWSKFFLDYKNYSINILEVDF